MVDTLYDPKYIIIHNMHVIRECVLLCDLCVCVFPDIMLHLFFLCQISFNFAPALLMGLLSV